MYTETFDQSIKGEQAKICSETLDGSGSSKHSDSNPEVMDGSGSSIDSARQIDVITRGESDKNNYSDTHVNGNESISALARRSSSSSSSESSSDDFFPMDAFKFTLSGTSTPASKSGKNYVSNESSAKSEVENGRPVPTSTCQVYNVTHDQMGVAPTLSPPIQVMDRSGGYDRSRIPSSVFERNSTSLEWSIASNDSLFSIHLGNISFSREQAILIGELATTGELNKSGELNVFSQNPSVILEEIDTARKSVAVEDLQTTEMSDEAFKLEERLSEDQNEIKNSHQATSRKSSNVSSLSHGSRTSVHSFAFPIKKRAWPLCYCSNCSRAFCYYKWPTCYLMWPSCDCSNCGWAFCYRWNCSHTKWCYHTSPILTEAERNSSAKTDVPRQQSFKQASKVSSKSNCTASCCNWFQRKQPSEVTPNSTSNYCSWFHCFSCPSCTCKPSCTWNPSCTWGNSCC